MDCPKIAHRLDAITDQRIKVKHVGLFDETLHIEATIQDEADVQRELKRVVSHATLQFTTEYHCNLENVTMRNAITGQTKEYDLYEAILLSSTGLR